MARLTKQKRELIMEQEAHERTRQKLDDAYSVAQYLRLKVGSLWSLIAQCTNGGLTAFPLHGYNAELEQLEKIILQRATERDIELEEAPTEPDVDHMRSEDPPPAKRQKRSSQAKSSSRKSKASSPVPDSSPPSTDAMPMLPSDGSVKPADLLFSTCLPSDSTLPSDPWSDTIDPVILAQQTEAAREIMGELVECPVAQRIIGKAGDLTKMDLERMKAVLEADVDARVDVSVFADLLLGE